MHRCNLDGHRYIVSSSVGRSYSARYLIPSSSPVRKWVTGVGSLLHVGAEGIVGSGTTQGEREATL